ncbi:LuxR C-terminal-related transcriptional regulator [candidate division KSB1 bacterium]
MPVNIHIVDGCPFSRDGLVRILESGGNINFPCKNGNFDLSRNDNGNPEIDILIIRMYFYDVISESEIFRNAVLNNQLKKILIIDRFTAGLFSLLKDRRIYGLLPTESLPGEIRKSINFAMKQKLYISPEFSHLVNKELNGSDNSIFVLSTKEKEVLKLITSGYYSSQAAERLGICIRTVNTHRQNIMNKLELFNVADLTKYAILNGLTKLKIED